MKKDRHTPRCASEEPHLSPAEAHPAETFDRNVIKAGRCGEWLTAEELHEKAMALANRCEQLCFDFEGLSYLEAGVLQLLLACDVEERKRGRILLIENVSPELHVWFEYGGVAERFLSPTEQL